MEAKQVWELFNAHARSDVSIQGNRLAFIQFDETKVLFSLYAPAW